MLHAELVYLLWRQRINHSFEVKKPVSLYIRGKENQHSPRKISYELIVPLSSPPHSFEMKLPYEQEINTVLWRYRLISDSQTVYHYYLYPPVNICFCRKAGLAIWHHDTMIRHWYENYMTVISMWLWLEVETFAVVIKAIIKCRVDRVRTGIEEGMLGWQS